MSYLAQYASHGPTSIRRARRGARVDERITLNYPEFDGGAHVRVFVEDTSAQKVRRWCGPPSPKLRLRIADCANVASLEFGVEYAEFRENSLYKIDTLIAALQRFRDAYLAEAELYAARERELAPR